MSLVLGVIGGVLLSRGDYVAFGWLFTLDNIAAIIAMVFYLGPIKYIKSVLQPSRLPITIVYWGLIVATIALCLTPGVWYGWIILAAVAQKIAWVSIARVRALATCPLRA